jgi:hypothetical protein
MTSKSFFHSHKTDKLLAGPSMARHVKEAISKGGIATKLAVFELHPALHVNRIHTSRSLGWLLGCCAMEKPMFSFYDAADVVFDSIDPVMDIPRHSNVERMFLSQPPVRDIKFNLKCHCGGNFICSETHFAGLSPKKLITIHDDTGITFGQLRDSVQLALIRYPTAIFGHLMFGEGFAVTGKEKQAVEAAGALSWKHSAILCR